MQSASRAATSDHAPRRRPEEITAELLSAAAVEFAAHGFDGASTRNIARRAGAHQPQINYHFSSKEHLWRATVDHLFDLLGPETLSDTAWAGSADFGRSFSDGIRRFLRFSADHPELNRIVNLEATSPSGRLEWLVATHLRPRFAVVGVAWEAVRGSGRGADLTAAEVWEIITSYGALHFANAPMLSMLAVSGPGERPDPDAHADRVLSLLFPGAAPARGPSATGRRGEPPPKPRRGRTKEVGA